jgi:cytochrome P450
MKYILNLCETIFSTGNQWFHQRKILTPSFHFEVLRQFMPIFVQHSNKFVEYLEQKCVEAKGAPIDVRMPLTLATLDMICGKTGLV